jgi:hypothetical protein
LEAVVEQQQTQAETADTAAPVVQSEETSAQPEQQAGTEGTEKKVETEETPQRRESRRQRQLNRERERRIAAETELRLLREARQERQQPQQPVDDAPKREQFDTYEEYLRADARYIAAKEAKETARKEAENLRRERESERSKETQSKQLQEWNAKIEKARDAVEDFDEVCAESDAVITPPMASAIQESDQGALIAYYLAKNPDEAERISKLSPSRQAAAIVTLEDKVAKPAKKPSKAPAPINPVGTKVEVGKDPAKMSQAEYNEWRRNGGK